LRDRGRGRAIFAVCTAKLLPSFADARRMVEQPVGTQQQAREIVCGICGTDTKFASQADLDKHNRDTHAAKSTGKQLPPSTGTPPNP
jgi:hypothetical protein